VATLFTTVTTLKHGVGLL